MRRILGSLLVFAAGALMAQSIPPADLAATMRDISQSLGVTCNYCHSAERGSGQPEPKKDVARAMMAMTRDINAKIQAAIGKPPGESTRVQCVTCHRGVTIPGQLSDILTKTVREKGVPEAAAQYRELRKRYYGRQSYDFSEDTLLTVAQPLSNKTPDDAIALLQLNLEFNPQSVRTYTAIAYAYTRKLDDTSAIANLEKAHEIEPENGIVNGQLEQLKSYRRKK
jgi:tetratricopeptide (TPR) repeat protein